jgi:uncharacterized protein YdbL (DUF1318 family)
MSARKLRKAVTLVIFVLIALARMDAHAQPEIKARMMERVPIINSLKAKGVVGEANTGFLVVRDRVNEKAKEIVNVENQDRRQVYSSIARQQKTTPELVGKRRALKIIEIAQPGTWLQRKDGAWYQK